MTDRGNEEGTRGCEVEADDLCPYLFQRLVVLLKETIGNVAATHDRANLAQVLVVLVWKG